EAIPSLLISTMSFALGKVDVDGPTQAGWNVEVLQALGLPILQAITSGMEQDQWLLSTRGLSPLDTAMNVALPEFDGRIGTVPISFKGEATLPSQANDCQSGTCGGGCQPSTHARIETTISEYVPLPDRI